METLGAGMGSYADTDIKSNRQDEELALHAYNTMALFNTIDATFGS